MKDIEIRIKRRCAICGATIAVTVYEDGRYSGGEYFGKMPELAMRKRHGVREDPALAEEVWLYSDEYWECLDCAGR